MTTYVQAPPKDRGFGNAEIIVLALTGAALVELVVLRTFTRTAVHIPALHALRSPYELLTNFGEFAYFAALCLVAPALVALGIVLNREKHPQRYLIGFGIASFLVAWALVGGGALSSETIDATTVGSVCALAAAVLLVRPDAGAIPVLLFAIAFAASASYTVLGNSAFEQRAVQPGPLLNVAEFAGIAYAISSPLLVPARPDRFARWFAFIAVALVFTALLGNGSTSRFLLLWNAGLSGTLPSFFYAAAGGALVYTFVAATRANSPFIAAGVILLVVGGIGLHSTYQTSLVLAGLASLAAGTFQGVRRGEATARPTSSASAMATPSLTGVPGRSTEPASTPRTPTNVGLF